MPLIRCSDQKDQTLFEFYAEYHDERLGKMGVAMLSLIQLLDSKFKDTTLYGLTSLYRLNLLARDTYKSPWHVCFVSDGDIFYIEYLVPTSEHPEGYARITDEASSLDEAYKYVLIAMSKCGGWADNTELQRLLANA